MDGFVSIDVGTSAVAVDAASAAQPPAGAVPAAGRQSEMPAPSDRTVDAFRAAMAGPLAENAAVEAAFDTAVKSFAAAMAAVPAAVASQPGPGSAEVAVPSSVPQNTEPGSAAPVAPSYVAPSSVPQSPESVSAAVVAAPSVPQAPEIGTAVPVAAESAGVVKPAVAPEAPVVPAAPAVKAEASVPGTVVADGVVPPAVPEASAKVADGAAVAPAAPQTQGVVAAELEKPAAVYVAEGSSKPEMAVPVEGEEGAVPAEAQPVRAESGKPQPVARVKDVDETPEASAENIVAAGIAPRVQEAAPVAQADPSGVQSVEAVSARTVEVADRVAKAMSASEVLLQAAEAVADAILVSPGLLRGEGEIRVQLKPDVLEGTEIRIGVAGTKMEVSFMPRTEDMSALIEQCRPQLEQHLAARIHRFTVGVSVDKKSRVRDE